MMMITIIFGEDDSPPKKVVLMTISTPPSEQHGQQVRTTLSVSPISRFLDFKEIHPLRQSHLQILF